MGVFCTCPPPGANAIDTHGPEGKDAQTATTGSTPVARADGASRFELAPPRRFILPAILLLLSEQPDYGYGLVPRLETLQFGQVDRPAIYRALAQLEQDGLVLSTTEGTTAGQARRVYSITPSGERVLRAWMGVVLDEHDRLGQVVRRYRATRSPEALLAEAEGGWSGSLGRSWSRISASSPDRQPLHAVAPDDADDADDAFEILNNEPGSVEERALRVFRLDPERSAVLIDVRSTVGPMSFGTLGVSGTVEVTMTNGSLSTDVPPKGNLQFDVRSLRSGNRLYDAELLRRIDARRFPLVKVSLDRCTSCGLGPRYNLTGDIAFHGVSRRVEGTVSIDSLSDSRLSISGEQSFDIRDFAVPSPSVLMLRIYPDLRVRLQIEAVSEEN
jgi:DNA-binding PadR family transcriptional regulator